MGQLGSRRQMTTLGCIDDSCAVPQELVLGETTIRTPFSTTTLTEPVKVYIVTSKPRPPTLIVAVLISGTLAGLRTYRSILGTFADVLRLTSQPIHPASIICLQYLCTFEAEEMMDRQRAF